MHPGERPALKELTDRYPELAEEIRELFPAMVRVEQAEGGRPGEEKKEATEDSRPANPPLRQIGDYRILDRSLRTSDARSGPERRVQRSSGHHRDSDLRPFPAPCA